MYKLYYSPGTASLAVHWMLLEIGAPFELERVTFATAEQKRPEFLKLNPKGQVPVLLIDGRPFTQSAALLMILAERHPERGLAPALDAPERGAYIETMIYLANELLPAFRAWFYVDDFASAPHHDDAKAHARARIEASFDWLDARLADGRRFIASDRLSAADFLTTMLARWARRMPRPADSWSHLSSYLARMKQLPSLREVHAREGLTDWI